MKKLIYILTIIAIAILFYIVKTNQISDLDYTKIIIDDKIIEVEIADTVEKHYQGLSNRENLCDNCGMLFVFPDKEERVFVMRDMNFPLDIIWISDDKIVKIDKNLLPEGSNPKMLYSSGQPVNYVLEINSGYAGKHGFKTGDMVKYNY
ncbi:MAG: DUF192 domain-containing protein [bacterium]|nr:DUF192 domain-containing protein [bacterium]